MIKLVVLDVDGTLTEKDRTILPEVVEAIPQVQKNAVISLVSGNVIPVMYALKTYLGTNGPVFGENGGIMLDGQEIRTFFSIDEPRNYFSYLEGKIGVSGIMTNRWRETSVAFDGDRSAIIGEAEASKSSWGDKIEVVDSTYSWHILNKGQNKAFAIGRLMEMYGLEGDEVLACGDSDNDLSMYSTPARKATVANASDAIKHESEFVSDNGFGRGVVEIFRHFALL